MDNERFFASFDYAQDKSLRMTKVLVASELDSDVNSPWTSQGATKPQEDAKKCS